MSPSRPPWFRMSVDAIHRVGALEGGGRHASKIAKGANPHCAVLFFDARLASPDSQRRTATAAGATAGNTRSSRTRNSSRNSLRFYQSSSGRKLPVGGEVFSGHESSQTAARG